MSEVERVASRVVRIGLVGCGMIGRVHAQRLVQDKRGEIRGFYDRDSSAAHRLRDELVPSGTVYADLDELLGGCPLDALIICTPTLFHFDQVQAARQRGLHVLCEKPLADTRDRIVSLVNAASAGGPHLSVSYQRRYDSLYRTMRRDVRSGRYGPVQSITSHNAERWQQTIAHTWRDDPKLNPGGFLGDAGSHKIDMLFYITGLDLREVFAHGTQAGSHVEIVTTLTGLLGQDVTLSMNFIGNAQHWREDLHIHCAEADLAIRDNAYWIGRNNRFERVNQLEPGSSPDAAFLDVLTAGAANEAPAECALPVFDFTQAVLESARTGILVRLA